MSEKKLLVGAGKCEVRWDTLSHPVEGFTATRHKTYIRSLLLMGTEDMLLISLEITSLPAYAIEHFKEVAARESGLKTENIHISVTHTFSVPHIPNRLDDGEKEKIAKEMFSILDDALKVSVQESLGQRSEASVYWGTSNCNLNLNRNIEREDGWWIGRNPESYSNHTVRNLLFYHGDQLLAAMVNYDCQPSVLDHVFLSDGSKLISGDFTGIAMQCLEERYEGAVVISLPGAAGDQTPMIRGNMTDSFGNEVKLQDRAYDFAEQFAMYLSDCVDTAIEKKERIKNAEIREYKTIAYLPEQIMKYGTFDLTPHRSYDFENTGNQIESPITLLKIGDLNILMAVPELNSKFGEGIRQMIGEKLIIGTLVDGASKYMPEEDDFQKITYTAMNTMIGRGADEIFKSAVRELLESSDRKS